MKDNIYRPAPYRPGNTILCQYEEELKDRSGHTALVTKIDYRTSKGKMIKGFTLFVKWIT